MIDVPFFVSDKAIVHETARIGSGTFIWHFTYVREGAQIGNNCVIGTHVTIGKNVVIGDGVHIADGARLYEGVIIRNNVFIGNNVSFTNVKYPRAWRKAREFLVTVVEENATVDANAVIHAGLHIGKGSTVGCGAIVVHDVSPGGFVVTAHAQCICNLEDCKECNHRKQKKLEKHLKNVQRRNQD